MPKGQLSIFKQSSVGTAPPRQLAPAAAPTGESSIMQTLRTSPVPALAAFGFASVEDEDEGLAD